ncbi:MAG: tail fiber protein [Saprospiraceae bacterium]|nr:tail fiber protein [Saprospiraceae bacterium]
MQAFLGQIQPIGFNFAPRGWALCEGQLYPINQYQALFSLLGTMYGGDGRTTFALPDLRSRNLRGEGSGPGLDRVTYGQKAGNNQQQLTTATMPSHHHTGSIAFGGSASGAIGSNKYLAANTIGTNIFADAVTPARSGNGGIVTNNTGGSIPFNSLTPFLGIYVCIAITGLFPSRS